MTLNNNNKPVIPQVNAATVPLDNILELAKLVKDLQQEVKSLRTQGPKVQSNTPVSTSKDINPKSDKPWRRYCHTHGCCNHWGRQCKDKAPGHKDEATFRNRMGGSNFNCLPVQE